MEKMKMVFDNSLTFEEGCELYLDSCRIRNLREGTINHYKQSYTQFYKFFDRDMLVSKITQKKYNEYILFLRSHIDNDVSINAYLRDFITTMHFLMREGYLEPFPMRAIKVDKPTVTTYTDAELRALLKKPNLRECNFMEYECWVITNLLFSTGIRQRSLIHLKVKDIDFDNHILHVNVTKNRKALLVSLSATMIKILEEFLKYRQHTSGDDPLFCSVMGNQMTRSISYLIAFDDKSKQIRTFRIDRMAEVKRTGELREGAEEFKKINLESYAQEHFGMFGGKKEHITLRFIMPLLDTVVDRFGTRGVIYSKDDERHFRVTTTVVVSDQFFGWLCGFGNKVKIISPSPIVEDFKKYLTKINALYSYEQGDNH